MESLIDSLDPDKWQTIDTKDKTDGFKEFKVMRQHKEDPKGTFKYLIQEEDGDPKAVYFQCCKCGHDPLKDIGTCEVKLGGGEGNVIVGVDLDGDIVVQK